jgi:hypothetical protein
MSFLYDFFSSITGSSSTDPNVSTATGPNASPTGETDTPSLENSAKNELSTGLQEHGKEASTIQTESGSMVHDEEQQKMQKESEEMVSRQIAEEIRAADEVSSRVSTESAKPETSIEPTVECKLETIPESRKTEITAENEKKMNVPLDQVNQNKEANSSEIEKPKPESEKEINIEVKDVTQTKQEPLSNIDKPKPESKKEINIEVKDVTPTKVEPLSDMDKPKPASKKEINIEVKDVTPTKVEPLSEIDKPKPQPKKAIIIKLKPVNQPKVEPQPELEKPKLVRIDSSELTTLNANRIIQLQNECSTHQKKYNHVSNLFEQYKQKMEQKMQQAQNRIRILEHQLGNAIQKNMSQSIELRQQKKKVHKNNVPQKQRKVLNLSDSLSL